MGACYKMKCKHCGTEFMHIADDDFGVMRACVGCECGIEGSGAIRCPECHTKLNNTQAEFESQTESVMTW